MDEAVPILPLPLLFLVHLQILQFPGVNDDQFDIDIFNAHKRGLRARIKLMEDLAYWLVERIEGKNVFPTYPCLKPSETTAFRTSFARYLETLRQNSLKGNQVTSVWWRNVQARKSLLEECAGDKFLRLLVAFSTHILHTAQAHSKVDPRPDLSYASRLLVVQSSQRGWVNSGLKLMERERMLANMQLSVSSNSSQYQSKYAFLSTRRLIALRDSKLEDILCREVWSGDGGRRALDFFVYLAGVRSDAGGEKKIEKVEPKKDNCKQFLTHDREPEAQPLLIAAAHHPSHIKRLKKSVLTLARIQLAKSEAPARGGLPLKLVNDHTQATVALRGYHEAVENARFSLETALNRLKAETIGLQKQMDTMKARKSHVKMKEPKSTLSSTRNTEARAKLKCSAPIKTGATIATDVPFAFWKDEEGGSGTMLRLNFNAKPTSVDEYNMALSLITQNEIQHVRDRLFRAARI
ncbi:hypothetical protein GYMLUDRAFT_264742 [Collybiopsis luxurians FD-317 M1]|uniref:HAUS augmin-like complex subunit 6 N-terminal domain-containing protein n=1 Tax=Collybiopsis luxurians FD-317 M1 TaxID=944289 RepID=A0A0D0CGY8_9AGAR|nr:hypothetical protein GYMLUDRAFT_264742 [Collybiopsis luxurians FD-317 M1]